MPLALTDGEGAGEAAVGAAPAAEGLASASAIGFAGAGDFWASSATVNFIACVDRDSHHSFVLIDPGIGRERLRVFLVRGLQFFDAALARFSS